MVKGYTEIIINYRIKNNKPLDIIKVMDKTEEILIKLQIPFNKNNVLYIEKLNQIHVNGGLIELK
jgi:hypothetical protein